MASLWFSGKEMLRSKKLCDYLGRNDKTRAVVKLQKIGQGAPGREPVMTETEQKEWMLHAYHKQEEMKVGEQPSSSSLEHVDTANVTHVDTSSICKVEPRPSAPSMPIEDDDCEPDSSDFIYRMLNSSNGKNEESSVRTRVEGSALSNITSVIDGSQYSLFNLHR